MIQFEGSSARHARETATEAIALSTRIDDLAARTADQATELYSKLERESRTRRFDRALERAGQPV